MYSKLLVWPLLTYLIIKISESVEGQDEVNFLMKKEELNQETQSKKKCRAVPLRMVNSCRLLTAVQLRTS